MEQSTPQSLRAIAPLAVMSAVAWLSALVTYAFSSEPLYWVSFAIFVVNLSAMLRSAGHQSQWLLRVSPYCYLLAATLLILSQADTHAGLSIILLLPVLAVALRGTHYESWGIVAGMSVALLAIQIDHHTSVVVMIRVLLLWCTLGAVVSVTIHGLRDGLEGAHMELAAKARTDPLTGIANRRGLAEAIPARRGRRSFALLCLDVDGLKALNDSRGHGAGDELLIAVAQACQRVARPSDVVARLGGDEFAIFIADADEREAMLVASRVADAIRAIRLDEGRASASIGAASGSGDAQWEDVLRKADARMYENKRLQSQPLGARLARLPVQAQPVS